MSPWGQPEEYKSKILLTLRGKESVMAKWEVCLFHFAPRCALAYFDVSLAGHRLS